MKRAVALSVALVVALVGGASSAGPGGWDHLGDGGTPGTASLNGTVSALDASVPGVLYVGGNFTSAGGNPAAARIAAWDGSAWSAVGSPPLDNGIVDAIASYAGRLFVGGTFLNAGGDPNADFLAVWDGVRWAPFCNPAPAFGGTVSALRVIGSTLYVGGHFQNGAGIAAADYLLACDLNTGASSSTVTNDGDFTGAIDALTSDSKGTLYVAGGFSNLDQIAAADNVAAYDGAWHAMGSGPGPGLGAVDTFARAIASDGTNVYVGTDAVNVAGIPQADHVVRWDGSAWNALGANAAGTDGWLPASTSINGIAVNGSDVVATGTFQNADGNPLADNIASFATQTATWSPLGSDGAGNGPWNGNGLAVAPFAGQIVAGGSFTSAGGDQQARSVARYPAAFEPPPPTFGKSVNVRVVKGTVLVKEPGASGFVAVTDATQIAVGSKLDTTAGTVLLTSARDTKGHTQSVQLNGGVFKILQSARNHGRTDLNLSGGHFGSCHGTSHRVIQRIRGETGAAAPRGAPATAARKRRRATFRTRGRFAAATVRGTVWGTIDRCDGTLTWVKRGTVEVRDLVRKRTITLRPPHRYLARPPR